MLVLVLAVVAVECVVAYLCIPSASRRGVAGSGRGQTARRSQKRRSRGGGEGEGDGTVEVDLKEYSVTVFQAASNSTMRIDFHLYGIVAKEDEKRI